MRKIRRPAQRWAAITAVVATLALIITVYADYRLGLRPVEPNGCVCAPVSFTVGEGWNAQIIAGHLAGAGLIRSRNAFITYVNFHGLRPRLKAGTYSFKKTQSANDMAEDIAAGRTTTKRLLVPEGYTISQIESAAAVFGITKAEFEAALNSPHTESFLATKPASVSLEGYLFPDSYEVDSTSTAASLVQEMLDNFGSHVGSDYQQAFAAEGLSLHQGLTIASIVEREVNVPTDRPIVAQIFIKRLRSGMPLGSDVTACYAYQQNTGAATCNDNLAIGVQSPYNTTLGPGLPPGPICSPGLNALDAVAHPAATGYLYFFTDKHGTDHFENTFAEQEANIAKYGLAGQ